MLKLRRHYFLNIFLPWLKWQDLTKNFADNHLLFLFFTNRTGSKKAIYLTFSVQHAYSTVITLFKTECVQARDLVFFMDYFLGLNYNI